MARGKTLPPGVTAVEVQDYERPLYKVYRPSPAAHSNHIILSPPQTSLPLLPSATNRRARNSNPRAHDAAAVNRLLAPEYTSSGIAPEQRRSLVGDSGLRRSGSGASTGAASRGSGEHGARKSRGDGARRRLGLKRHEDEEERDEALGVYIDSHGKLHDGDFDPFETVRNASRRKYEKQTAFGAAREDDSEAGSEVGSAVSRNGRGGGGVWSASLGSEEARMSKRLSAQRQAEEDAEAAAEEARHATEGLGITGGGGERGPWEDYDSGYSERGGLHVPNAQTTTVLSPTRSAFSPTDALSPSVSSFSAAAHGTPLTPAYPSFKQPHNSVASNRYPFLDREEHAQALLLSNNAPTPRPPSSSQSQTRSRQPTTPRAPPSPSSLLEPPNPPFAAGAGPSKPRAKRTDSLASLEVLGAGTGPIATTHAIRGSDSKSQKAPSTVFSGHDMGYLPSRWASGDKEFRQGEERERYRPKEWTEEEWTPGCGEGLKRQWHDLMLSLRFSSHRTKKKIERKVHHI